MKNTVFDCNNKNVSSVNLSEEELTAIEQNHLAWESERVLKSLEPSADEVRKAEIEIVTLNLLTEVGLL